eukprot:COSAG06_NODE_676_length_13150_cov_3.664164_5_plen_113_part_00
MEEIPILTRRRPRPAVTAAARSAPTSLSPTTPGAALEDSQTNGSAATDGTARTPPAPTATTAAPPQLTSFNGQRTGFIFSTRDGVTSYFVDDVDGYPGVSAIGFALQYPWPP